MNWHRSREILPPGIRRSRTPRMVTATVIAGILVTASAAASAGSSSADPPGPAGAPVPAAIAAALAYTACVAGGPTTTDTAIADQVRPAMNGSRLGKSVNSYNVSCARVITETARGRNLDKRAAVIAVTTAITESTLHNYTEAGDHDSLGLFQQRPSQGWGTPAQLTDPIYATNAFLNAMIRKFPNNSWMQGDIGAICQKVQVSAVPDAYAREVHDAQLLVDALWTRTVQEVPVVVAAQSSGVVDAFFRGPGGGLGHTWFAGGAWHGPEMMGDAAPIGSVPNVVTSAPGVVDVFWKGTNAGLWHKHFDGQAWQPIEPLPMGTLGSPPHAVGHADGRVEVFWTGTDGGLWTGRFTDGAWSGPIPLNAGTLGSEPVPVTTSANVTDVFWRGGNGGLWHSWTVNAGATWNGPEPLPMGTLGSPPVAAGQPNGRVDVLWKGTDNALWSATYTGGIWTGPTTHGGTLN